MRNNTVLLLLFLWLIFPILVKGKETTVNLQIRVMKGGQFVDALDADVGNWDSEGEE